MKNLSLAYTGIGSLPFSDKNAPSDAIDFIFNCCKDFPFWAQLPHYKKEEDMVFQFTQNLVGLKIDNEGKFYLDDECQEFFEGLESLFMDYETVINSDTLIENEEILDKYKICAPYSNTLELFLSHLKDKNPQWIKGSITGPFTFSTSLGDKNGKLAYYNETLRELIIKFLSLKALWQVKEFKKYGKNSTPVIFMDEPSISQVGSCAFVTVKNKDVSSILETISNDIKKFNALSGVHCCGKTDWDIAIESNVNIINFDAYLYSESVSTFAQKLKKFITEGGFLSFGIVPTMDKNSLETLNIDTLYKKFQESLYCLTSKGIDKNLILDHCFFTPSCGCGSLDVEMAKKALQLTKELSEKIKSEVRKDGVLL